MNTDNFLIEAQDLTLAQDICKFIENEQNRNRAVANAMASTIAVNYFDKTSYDVDDKSGLHNIGKVLEDIDIADIYLNGAYVDVRVYFNEEELSVPVSHFKNDLLPNAYMFIKITPDISSATVSGFIIPENINVSSPIDGYYCIDESDLISFYDVESYLARVDDLYNVEDSEIFAYLDNKLSDKNAFYAKLLKSKDGRLRLAKFAKAQTIFNFISMTSPVQELQNDETLDFSDEDTFSSLEDVSDVDLLDTPIDELSGGIEELNPVSDSIDFLDEDVEPLDIDNTDEDIKELEENTDITDDLVTSIETENVESLDENSDVNDNTAEESFKDILEENDIKQDASYDFKTEVTPTIDSTEEVDEIISPEDLDSFLDETIQKESSQEILDDVEENSSTVQSTQTEQIDMLYKGQMSDDEQINTNESQTDNFTDDFRPKKSNSSLKFLLVVGFLAVMSALAYLGFTKFSGQSQENELPPTEPMTNTAVKENNDIEKPVDAMPIETVENIKKQTSNDEGNSLSIPAIENNLDASILVSNLKVNWEVPSGYVTNTTAQRYLVKLGKIIQLNLKTELLLLNKPPITNKIAVEIKYNDATKKFEMVDIITSSGEQEVDNLVKQIVTKALNRQLNMNTDSLGKLQGNPVLIIHL